MKILTVIGPNEPKNKLRAASSLQMATLSPFFLCYSYAGGCPVRPAIRSYHFGSVSLSARPERRHRLAAPRATLMAVDGAVVHDLGAAALTAGVALGLLRFWEELAKREIFEQKMNRKLVHISIGLTFMLFWPLFSSEVQAPYLAAIAPGINIFRMLLMGLGIWKSEATVKSISRNGDYRELLKGPLYYACTITLATIFWRTSPVAIAAICNMCAGDGVADIIGRRFGKQKLPYNQNKSLEGSLAMFLSGFIASILYLRYYSWFGFIQESPAMIIGFLVVSFAAALIESLPISTDLDDNLTVPFTSVVVASLVF